MRAVYTLAHKLAPTVNQDQQIPVGVHRVLGLHARVKLIAEGDVRVLERVAADFNLVGGLPRTMGVGS